MITKWLILAASVATLSACTCATPMVVTQIQKSDKKLTCKDVILEINEAEHYKDLASREKGVHFGNMLMPACWVTGYFDSTKAINAANARIAYLGNIYDVLDCGGDDTAVGQSSRRAPVQSNALMQKNQVQPYPSLQNVVEDHAPMIQGEVDDSAVRRGMHKHIKKDGSKYMHSHYHAGPHRHGGDK